MKIFVALTALLISCAASFAGTEPMASSGKEAAPAPAVAECHNWTAFYVGCQAGWAFADADVHGTLTGAWDGPDTNHIQDFDVLNPLGNHDLNDGEGGRAGGFLGYNYQLGNHIVLGLE